MRYAVATDPNLVSAHRALATADIPSQERSEEIEKVAALERAQPAEAYNSIDASVFDRGFSQSTKAGNLSMNKQEQLRAQIDASRRDYPDLAAVRLAAGFAYVILGELENGQTQIREALRLEHTLAEALLQNGDTIEALRTEEQAAQLASTNSKIQNRLLRFREAVQSQTASNP